MFENENVIYKNIDGVEILQFKKLLEYNNVVTHGYCLGTNRNFRTGRVNGGKITPQEYNKALDDYKNLCNRLCLNYTNLVKTIQTHTDNISNIETRSYIAKELPEKPLVEYTATTRESLLMGPGGAVKVESVWTNNRLLTILVKGGN